MYITLTDRPQIDCAPLKCHVTVQECDVMSQCFRFDLEGSHQRMGESPGPVQFMSFLKRLATSEQTNGQLWCCCSTKLVCGTFSLA